MKAENDLLVLESILERNINMLLTHTRTKDKVAFIRDIITDVKISLPELVQAFEYLQLEKVEDINTPLSAEELIRATNIHHTIKIVYDCFRKNDMVTLKIFFKNLEIKQR